MFSPRCSRCRGQKVKIRDLVRLIKKLCRSILRNHWSGLGDKTRRLLLLNIWPRKTSMEIPRDRKQDVQRPPQILFVYERIGNC